MEIIDRQEARRLGLKRYFTGKPCKHGHVAERRVDGGCVECIRDRERQPDVMEKYRARRRRNYDPELAQKQRLANLDRRRETARESARRRRTEEPKIRERDRENARLWVQNNPERRSQYLLENRDKILERSRDHARSVRAENPAKARAAVKRWRMKNPEKDRESNLNHLRRRRMQKQDAGDTFRIVDWNILAVRSKHCHWCGRPFNEKRRRTHDHVVPLAKGGANTLENSVCACADCNRRKSARLINPVTGQGILL